MQANAYVHLDAFSVQEDLSNVILSWELRQTPKTILSSEPTSLNRFQVKDTYWGNFLYQDCAAVHFQEQSISFTVFNQRAGIYIKNRQTGREKIDGILFPAGRERESA